MIGHPAITRGRTAVITGAADGIGLAAAQTFAGLGLNVLMCDRNSDGLAMAAASAGAAAAFGARVETQVADVADPAQVTALKDRAFDRFGDVAVLMNNAGVGGGGHAFENPEGWSQVLAVNLGGVINGVQAFTQAMIDQGKPALIINTGSKQGITNPPGDTAYNVSKAGIKALTEGLQHSLRTLAECQVSAHLLIPGFTFTGLTRRRITDKPAGAWTAQQVVDFMLERLAADDFYILCPDNEVNRQVDNARITWAAQDLSANRPALSRWHPQFKTRFEAFMRGPG